MSWLPRAASLSLVAVIASGCGQPIVHFNKPTCADSIQNASETDTDCGGPQCSPCGDGRHCGASTDCQSGICLNQTCRAPAPTCGDGMLDGSETAIDCGGVECPACPDGDGCAKDGDCKSHVCTALICQAPSCNDHVQNGSETDVDCGGTCPACVSGGKCQQASDCIDLDCVHGQCIGATCNDKIKNSDETDVDCGGARCGPCSDGAACAQPADCHSGNCQSGKCQAPTCADKLKNGDETDVDCGGPVCGKCSTGAACKNTSDCLAGLCLSGQCAPASCQDGIRNGNETDVDCGGSCPACTPGKGCGVDKDCTTEVCQMGQCATALCNDNIQNGDETGVDCGGSGCPPCGVGVGCKTNRDCALGLCIASRCAAPSCQDGLWNGDETDVDCGGSCPHCGTAKKCVVPLDCQSGVCFMQVCQPPLCNDLVQNGDETDVDCGGSCLPCAGGRHCVKGTDCATGACLNGTCTSSCGDGILNGNETDVDCGGACPACVDGKVCSVAADCKSGVCLAGVCQIPTCTDKVLNGGETDVDCGGGTCPKCSDGQVCRAGNDCVNSYCLDSKCQTASCTDALKNGNETDVDCGGGTCATCGPGKSCLVNADCWNNDCDPLLNLCTHLGSVSVGGSSGAPDPTAEGSRYVKLDGTGALTVDTSARLATIARYMYISNSGEGTVSKIDPLSQKEVARYCTAPGCYADPSRASVSLDGDAGIANRALFYGEASPSLASAVKIAGDLSRCVDRNGNGKIDTFTGSGPVPAQFLWPANTTVSPDECVLWWTPLNRDRNGIFVSGQGTIPRTATWDARVSADGALTSNLYVGLYGTGELAQIDSATGQIVQQVYIGGNPYSSVFDRSGNLWVRDASTNVMIRVDTSGARLTAAFFGPATPCGYAITADRRGYIYSAGGTCVSRMDPSQATPSWESLTLPNACSARGPSLDADYNLWVPDTCYGAFHVDASAAFGASGGKGMVLKKALPLVPNVAAYFLGTGVDSSGIPWFINTEQVATATAKGPLGTIYRVDWKNNYAVTQLRVGTTPYVYSDLSGSQLALSSPSTGIYNKTFQPACGQRATWKSLTWVDSTPALTTVQVRYRAARDPALLPGTPFVVLGTEAPAIAQPATITLPAGTDPSYLQVELVLSALGTQAVPTVSSITATYSCP